MEDTDQMNPCAICLGGMVAGGGQATFTAECSHTFHFSCISASVAHGNLVCPLCNAQWRDLPFVRPTPVPQAPLPVHILQPPQPRTHPVDRGPGAVVLKTHTEYSAVARDSSSYNFAVLVHVKAPGITGAGAAGATSAPLDLVTVLDVSGSMSGHKLALLKQAMRFVIDNLGPDDRLSVVSFSSEAHRMTGLEHMTDAGKDMSVSAVESLEAGGGTNIAEGLHTAAEVLDERRHRNAVSSIVLLSDGQDNCTLMRRHGSEANHYEALIPPFFVRTGGGWSAPIHTFGFGNSHDAAAMHVIAEATGGTFSFIENEAVIQDAFAQCIGGLLSVVVQEARIAVACVLPGVRVISVKSRRYESRVDEDGSATSVRVGELYADEERRFLLFLVVPRAQAADGNKTALVKVVCSYRDPATGGDVSVTAEDAVVARPENAENAERSAEVERERVRVEAAEDIVAARAAAERGAHEEAVEILQNRQRVVAQSKAAWGGDPVIVALGAELREMCGLVSDQQSYTSSGRAYMLAGMSAHAQQRANWSQMLMPQEQRSTRVRTGGVLRRMASRFASAVRAAWSSAVVRKEASNEATLSYATPAMRAMLEHSRELRGGRDAQSSGPKGKKT